MAFFNKFLSPRSHEDCSKPSAIVCLQKTLLKTSYKNKKTGSRACLDGNPAVFIRKSIPLLRFAFSQDHALSTDRVFSCRPSGRLCHRHLQAECLQRTLLKHLIKTKRQAHAPVLMVIQQCSIFPGRRQPSIFDDEKLNFCVRYVYRWILFSIATGYGIITSFLEITILT